MARRTTDITQKFGSRVRTLRHQAALSQEELAERCELDRTYISGIERGKRNVALRNIEAIARVLNLSISQLMKGL
jgi:transcriptional regulator with XRE-family HTH domain